MMDYMSSQEWWAQGPGHEFTEKMHAAIKELGAPADFVEAWVGFLSQAEADAKKTIKEGQGAKGAGVKAEVTKVGKCRGFMSDSASSAGQGSVACSCGGRRVPASGGGGDPGDPSQASVLENLKELDGGYGVTARERAVEETERLRAVTENTTSEGYIETASNKELQTKMRKLDHRCERAHMCRTVAAASKPPAGNVPIHLSAGWRRARRRAVDAVCLRSTRRHRAKLPRSGQPSRRSTMRSSRRGSVSSRGRFGTWPPRASKRPIGNGAPKPANWRPRSRRLRSARPRSRRSAPGNSRKKPKSGKQERPPGGAEKEPGNGGTRTRQSRRRPAGEREGGGSRAGASPGREGSGREGESRQAQEGGRQEEEGRS